ncbi:MAG: DUF87 domain-containing protein [bacterium]|nr:DUF87 domain-containing protein [bacterium]
MNSYEKLGSFYLGRHHDVSTGKTGDTPLMYDAKDLTTHAICVGMTGSGKTGLCVGLLEEAALDGIPSLIIDPKGDMGNLLLTFPDLAASDFRPWIDEDAARRKGISVEQHAAGQAELWKNGLAKWGQTGERIRRLRESAEFTIFTPGSDSGVPVSILSSFAAPSDAVLADGDLMRDRVGSTASSLLGLLDISADPLTSREHILISTVLDHLWRSGVSVDLAGLIHAIQNPPVDSIGVMNVETFFPQKDRFALAMRLNGILAAPGFKAWLQGQPLDVGSMLYTSTGRPRVAICSIAHLSESERMFFVSLLLNQVVAWMRGRPGTSSLRALVYMDEIFGYCPPTAEPPSKKPLLTLLKQARAYGLGVVLATQNPVDLDYKGLSNTGTWMLGRLQTERDKLRVLDGLEGAGSGGSFDRSKMEQTLAGLGKRVFLMHNVHEREPVLFHTRWAMSYLRGPLTRDQIRSLTPSRPSGGAASRAAAPQAGGGSAAARPMLPGGVPQVFLPAELPAGTDAGLIYEPMLIGLAHVDYIDRRSKKLKHVDEIALLTAVSENSDDADWETAAATEICREELEPDCDEDGSFAAPCTAATQARSYTRWRKALSDTLYRSRGLELFKSKNFGLISEPGESEAEFRIRLSEQAREKRDRLSDKLRAKYARRATRLEERVRRAEQAVQKEQEQSSGQKLQTAISFGATLLSAVLGRKATSMRTVGRATTAARGVGRVMREGQDIQRAQQNLEALKVQLDELQRELDNEMDLIEERTDPENEPLESKVLKPRRVDVDVKLVALAWAPYSESAAGERTPLWREARRG